MSKYIFLTGGLGFLGSYLLREILLESDDHVYVLARFKDGFSAQQRLKDILQRVIKDKLTGDISKRITVVEGDITDKNLGIGSSIIKDLQKKVNIVYHSAALAEFRVPYERIKKINVDGTKNVLEFSMQCKNIEKFNHISSTFIAGDHKGKFSEKDLDVGQQFNNTYERSKFEAEILLRNSQIKKFIVSIFRPSIIAGSYESGYTSSFKMFYEPLHFLSLELFSEIPANANTNHNIIPVDIAAKAIHILSSNESKSETYHIISSNNGIFGHFMGDAGTFFHYRNPQFVPLEEFDLSKLSRVQLMILEPFIPYFNYKALFISARTEAKLKKYNFIYPKIGAHFYQKIYNYCEECGHIKKFYNKNE